MPNEGDFAPEVSLPDQDGSIVSLSSLRGCKVLVYFYPKAHTPGCTVQACALRDIASKISSTRIIGISPDGSARLKKFDVKYELGFTLLSDETHEAAETFGVWVEKHNYGKKYMGVQRSAFLIDEAGRLQRVWNKISPTDTPKNLLDALGK